MDMRVISILFAAIFIVQAVFYPMWAIKAYPMIGCVSFVFMLLFYANNSLKRNRLRFFGLPLILVWLPYAIFPERFHNVVWRY